MINIVKTLAGEHIPVPASLVHRFGSVGPVYVLMSLIRVGEEDGEDNDVLLVQASYRALANALGLSYDSLYYSVKKLKKMGLVETKKAKVTEIRVNLKKLEDSLAEFGIDIDFRGLRISENSKTDEETISENPKIELETEDDISEISKKDFGKSQKGKPESDDFGKIQNAEAIKTQQITANQGDGDSGNEKQTTNNKHIGFISKHNSLTDKTDRFKNIKNVVDQKSPPDKNGGNEKIPPKTKRWPELKHLHKPFVRLFFETFRLTMKHEIGEEYDPVFREAEGKNLKELILWLDKHRRQTGKDEKWIEDIYNEMLKVWFASKWGRQVGYEFLKFYSARQQLFIEALKRMRFRAGVGKTNSVMEGFKHAIPDGKGGIKWVSYQEYLEYKRKWEQRRKQKGGGR